MQLPDIDAVRQAAKNIAPFIRETPVRQSQSIDDLLGCRAYFKCENLQYTGAFKLRGATNAVLNMKQTESFAGVITHSSGNHAAALAYAAQQHHIPCHVVMPEDAPGFKQQAVRQHGANVTLCKPGMESRQATTESIMRSDSGLRLIHPYDNYDVIAGQGTTTLEFLAQQQSMDMLVVPVGGGGLIGGAGIVVSSLMPGIALIGVEPEEVDEAYRSLAEGKRMPATGNKTIADGLQAGIGERNFVLLQQTVQRLVTVSEQQIKKAMRLIHLHLQMTVEPSAAVGLAALLSGQLDIDNKSIGIILTGGNIEPTLFKNLI
ncbi:MAG TPA: threonine/serine dehydratase [Gammaproteobacteria bacterium]|jgi:threonine dehydratase